MTILVTAYMPVDSVSAFFGRHERHAKLTLLYPDARVLKDTVSRFAVEAYEKTFGGETLPRTAYASMTMQGGGSYDRAVSVARDDNIIVFPKASADACLIAAYALRKCEQVFQLQSWMCLCVKSWKP